MKTKWYLAHLVEFPIIRNKATLKLIKYKELLFWENLVLIKASSPTIAFVKANKMGSEYEYKTINTDGDYVEWKFAGVRELIEIGESIADKKELTFIESYEKSYKAIRNLIPPKDKLLAFKIKEKKLRKNKKKNKEEKMNFQIISNELRENSLLAKQKLGRLNDGI